MSNRRRSIIAHSTLAVVACSGIVSATSLFSLPRADTLASSSGLGVVLPFTNLDNAIMGR